jgi:hypothetical protein
MAEMALFLKSFAGSFNLSPTASQPQMRALVTLRPKGVLLGIQR